MGLPDIALTAQGNLAQTQMTTIKNIQYIIKESGLEPRLNMATANVDFFNNGAPMEQTQAVQENAELTFLDLCTYCRIKQHDQVRAILANIAKFNAFHPMEDWLKSLPPAAGDPIGDLIDSVSTENELWPVYLENWLVQVVEGVCGWRDREAKKSLPHVLVLVGAQGVGKSRWLKQLGRTWFKGEAELHLGSSSGKDHQLAALRFPMVELSELDGIFRKADVAQMKAFISREEDEIRAPYDRKALVRPRMTSFCGSVNQAEFLNDDTGSRRFWPVVVDKIDWSYQVDFEGLWAEAYRLWQEDSNFNLTAEQDRQRDHEALKTHSLVTELQEVITEYHRRHLHNSRFPEAPMNRTEILKMLFGGRAFGSKDISIAGKIIADISGKHRTIDGKQRAWMFPYNEFAVDRATWPDNISLKSV
jgi:predicted P-loop ATPase